MQSYAYGFPRLGGTREYKKVIEGYWNKKLSEEELRQGIHKLEDEMLATYQKYVDKFPVGEMTLYDNMFDTALMVGLYNAKDLDGYYNLCRGKDALEMTKWFNTNYHYLVPQFGPSFESSAFKPNWNKPKEKKDRYQKGVPYLIGPFTFLKLSKGIRQEKFGDYFLSLAAVYSELIKGFEEVHIDEPAFVMEVQEHDLSLIKKAYQKIAASGARINLFTYYDSVDFLKDLYELPVSAIGLDFVNGKRNLENIRRHGFPRGKTLIAGVVNGRNIWRTDIAQAVALLKELHTFTEDIVISNAAPLYHLPISARNEALDQQLLKRISFARGKLEELQLINRAYQGTAADTGRTGEYNTNFGLNNKVKQRIKNLRDKDFVKDVCYAERAGKQRKILGLPLFPTTTIGSFPQTAELRSKRAAYRAGKLNQAQYKQFIREKITDLIKFQEEIGLDVLVHGEFERTDMVEFFAQKLEGIATTKNGWIISYGTRGYRPPIIYGDISRLHPMTVEEIKFARGLTKKSVKGMLTGPVTILAWSFVREDIPLAEVAYQIALCLQDEIRDYERAGIKIIQIDEPAFREKTPIKKRDWADYFDWAVNAFNLASQSKAQTQIHTHMCYSEFGEIMEYIVKMDFDVITIEASRSRGDILDSFEKINFDRQIGLGVWDIHSPAVPVPEDMKKTVERALKVFPKENFWINPDCGLKTRDWPEVKASLKNMLKVAGELRSEVKARQ